MHYDTPAQLPQRDTRFGLSIGRFNLVCVCVLNLLGLLAACSGTSGSRALNVGEEPGSATGGVPASGGALSTGGVDGLSNQVEALAVHVEDDEQMTIEIVTLACAGECADVLAVAHGGSAPYTFSWDDGSTDPKRSLCPTSAAETFTVTVRDIGVTDGEFLQDPRTAVASVGAEVAECVDVPVRNRSQCEKAAPPVLAMQAIPSQLTPAGQELLAGYATSSSRLSVIAEDEVTLDPGCGKLLLAGDAQGTLGLGWDDFLLVEYRESAGALVTKRWYYGGAGLTFEGAPVPNALRPSVSGQTLEPPIGFFGNFGFEPLEIDLMDQVPSDSGPFVLSLRILDQGTIGGTTDVWVIAQ